MNEAELRTALLDSLDGEVPPGFADRTLAMVAKRLEVQRRRRIRGWTLMAAGTAAAAGGGLLLTTAVQAWLVTAAVWLGAAAVSLLGSAWETAAELTAVGSSLGSMLSTLRLVPRLVAAAAAALAPVWHPAIVAPLLVWTLLAGLALWRLLFVGPSLRGGGYDA